MTNATLFESFVIYMFLVTAFLHWYQGDVEECDITNPFKKKWHRVGLDLFIAAMVSVCLLRDLHVIHW